MSLASCALLRLPYRAQQFFASFCPRVSKEERQLANYALGDRLFPLFAAMSDSDQRHCLNVHSRLCKQGYTDKDLLVAALIHDTGKRNVYLWQRVAYVLLSHLFPTYLEQTNFDGQGWKAGLATLYNHEKIGGRLAKAAGASDCVVSLIECNNTDSRQSALRVADDSC